MEETGIIRRLDALGRIVIPREFRKLNRIEVGDPLEMHARNNGEIVLRKVDVAAKLKSVGELGLETLAAHSSLVVAVCGTEKWLCALSHARSLSGRDLSETMRAAVEEGRRTTVTCEHAGLDVAFSRAFLFPVIGESGVCGSVVAFKNEDLSELESALVGSITLFVAKSLQTF